MHRIPRVLDRLDESLIGCPGGEIVELAFGLLRDDIIELARVYCKRALVYEPKKDGIKFTRGSRLGTLHPRTINGQ